MKRVAFCDIVMPDLYLGHVGPDDHRRLGHNQEIIHTLERQTDLLKYPKFNIHRIKKDMPIDIIITDIRQNQEIDYEINWNSVEDVVNLQDKIYAAHKACLDDIKLIHTEYPETKIIAYTAGRPESFNYSVLKYCGIDHVLWRSEDPSLIEMEKNLMSLVRLIK